MSTTILSIVLGIGGMLGWGIYDFLGGVFQNRSGLLNPCSGRKIVRN